MKKYLVPQFLLLSLLVADSARLCVAEPPAGPRTLENLLGAPANPGPARPPREQASSVESPAPQPSKPAPKAPPQPVPDEAMVEAARELVRQAFGDDYDAATRNPTPLIQKLLTAAGATQDPARKYAMLNEAEGIATASGNVARAMQLIDTRAEAFAIDRCAARLETLKSALTPEARKDVGALARLYECAIDTAKVSIQVDALPQARAAVDLAEKVSKALITAAKAKKDTSLVKDGEQKQDQARELAKAISRRADMLRDYQQGLATLEAKPDDPEANGAVGRYLCFERGEWEKGLPVLAKGDRQPHVEAAKTELAACGEGKEPTGAQLFEIAGLWWTIAEAPEASGDSAATIKLHASMLYASARKSLSDPLEKAVAEKRAQQAEAALRPRGQAVPDDRIGKAPRGPGLIGRVTVGGQETGIAFHYLNGTVFRHDVVRQTLFMQGFGITGMMITLEGTLRVPADLDVFLWHMGGTPSGGVSWLYIDDREIGSVGDDREKNVLYRVNLPRGDHRLKWVLRGGDLGNNLIQAFEADSKRPLFVFHTEENLRRARTEPFVNIVMNSDRTQVPMISRWQPGPQ